MNLSIYKKTKGFSLIELIVAVTIIIVITSVSLYHQAQFSSEILISNAAYEIALLIRQAQVYGISSRGVDQTEYRAGYGVHFESTGAKPDSFQMFSDAPVGAAVDSDEVTKYDYYYNPDPNNVAGSDKELQPPSPIGLTQGQHIRRFCAHNSAAVSPAGWECWGLTPSLEHQAMSLDIVFVKPNPDAHIVISTDGGNTYTGSCLAELKDDPCTSNPATVYDQAKIVVESGLADKCRTVRIYATGQISVDPVDPTNPVGCQWALES